MADLVLAESHRLAQRVVERLLRGGRERDEAGLVVLAEPDRLDHLGAGALGVEAERGDLGLMRERDQQVLGPDALVAHQPRLLLRGGHDAAGSVAVALEHGYARRRYPRANNR